MKRYIPVLVLAGALVIGATVFLFTPSNAADGVQTSFLGVVPHDFDGTGAVPALVASVGSIDDTDISAAIDIYWTVPGTQEVHGAECSTMRISGDPNLALDHAILASEFPSGTSVRAVFNMQNSAGQAWTFARTSTIP